MENKKKMQISDIKTEVRKVENKMQIEDSNRKKKQLQISEEKNRSKKSGRQEEIRVLKLKN